MAMRVCMYCKHEVTYERGNRNLLKDGAVGFWTDPLTQQATCPDAPRDRNGQQLHNPGDVHTPPSDPAKLEEFLNGTYVPEPPKQPCGQMYGLGEDGEFLTCGLDEGHDGDCQPGTPVQANEGDSADVSPMGPRTVMIDVNYSGANNEIVTVSGGIDGLSMTLTFDKTKVGPGDVAQLVSMFPAEAQKIVLAELTGMDLDAINAMQEAVEQAQKPEKKDPPKILEDPTDIEKFLNGDD